MKWSNNFFENLFGFEWELTKSPAGAHQWKPKNGAGSGSVPDAHDPARKHAPTMLTTDLALRMDPAYEPISRKFHENPEAFADAVVTEANSTVIIPVPEGEYLALADKAEVKQWASKTDPTRAGLKVVIQWKIEDQSVRETVGRDVVTVRQDVMLDLTDDGKLDVSKGKNVALGKLRAAIDLNAPGQPFAISMIQGRMAKVIVRQRVDGETIYTDVAGVLHA